MHIELRETIQIRMYNVYGRGCLGQVGAGFNRDGLVWQWNHDGATNTLSTRGLGRCCWCFCKFHAGTWDSFHHYTCSCSIHTNNVQYSRHKAQHAQSNEYHHAYTKCEWKQKKWNANGCVWDEGDRKWGESNWGDVKIVYKLSSWMVQRENSARDASINVMSGVKMMENLKSMM